MKWLKHEQKTKTIRYCDNWEIGKCKSSSKDYAVIKKRVGECRFCLAHKRKIKQLEKQKEKNAELLRQKKIEENQSEFEENAKPKKVKVLDSRTAELKEKREQRKAKRLAKLEKEKRENQLTNVNRLKSKQGKIKQKKTSEKTPLKRLEDKLDEAIRTLTKIRDSNFDDSFCCISCEKIKPISQSENGHYYCLLYTSPSPRDQRGSRMPSSA